MQGAVELAVAAAVESVASLQSAGGVEGAGAGERGEGRFSDEAEAQTKAQELLEAVQRFAKMR